MEGKSVPSKPLAIGLLQVAIPHVILHQEGQVNCGRDMYVFCAQRTVDVLEALLLDAFDVGTLTAVLFFGRTRGSGTEPQYRAPK